MTDRIKANGIHYTPPDLAAFLASAIREHTPRKADRIHVLDPACGNGSLLSAFAETFPQSSRRQLILTGYETDSDALLDARARLENLPVAGVQLTEADFLTRDGVAGETSLTDPGEYELGRYDVVIANPPYVRTQVLGASQARLLAEKFGLTGRVDLYHAFAIAMANVLRPHGVLGLLTSNRFLSIRSGESLRRCLRSTFDIKAVYDLGDTKLFSAAVLPVIVVATKLNTELQVSTSASFCRVYQAEENKNPVHRCDSILGAIRDRKVSGIVETASGVFNVERGILRLSRDPGSVWSLSTPDSDRWLAAVREAQATTIDDVAQVRVGIKTTADAVFVRKNWDELPPDQHPEESVLHDLLTHHEAGRWIASGRPVKKVLYPHTEEEGKRVPIRLGDYPRAGAWLEANESRLRSRKYVIDSGRQWYEIWVPHSPSDWQRQKIVFPDISEGPRFFYDPEGFIVQGDCYWIVTRPDVEEDWLFIILAVCNSTFITRFYDTAFHNKLYSGRRRFMTQYVKQFPLPEPGSSVAKRLVQETRMLVRDGPTADREAYVNSLVWESFGLVED